MASTLKKKIKRHRLTLWINKQNLFISCLQETYHSFKYKYHLRIKGWTKVFQPNVLWELLQLIALNVPARLGCGIMYYKCGRRVCVVLFSAGFCSSSQHTKSTVNFYTYCEIIPPPKKKKNLC